MHSSTHTPVVSPLMVVEGDPSVWITATLGPDTSLHSQATTIPCPSVALPCKVTESMGSVIFRDESAYTFGTLI
jgi:hypothetical protein